MVEPAREETLRLGLALQGGGSHGAFTWGVLHELLAAPEVEIPALSGTSAGAINAVVYADGWMRRPDATRAGMRRTRWQGSGGSTRPPRPHSR